MVSKEYLQEINEYKRLLQSKYEHIPNQSGIYVFQREENGIKFAYVGQSKYLLNRLAEHLRGYKTRNPSHIDLSIKKHGLRSFDNPTGYDIVFWQVPEDRLNDEERYYINLYANAGYQLRNKTLGGQDKGKVDIAERKPTKTYRDGLKQGEITYWQIETVLDTSAALKVRAGDYIIDGVGNFVSVQSVSDDYFYLKNTSIVPSGNSSGGSSGTTIWQTTANMTDAGGSSSPYYNSTILIPIEGKTPQANDYILDSVGNMLRIDSVLEGGYFFVYDNLAFNSRLAKMEAAIAALQSK